MSTTFTSSRMGAGARTTVDRCANVVQEELARGRDLSIIRLVDGLIEHAYESRASDVHMDPPRTLS